MVDSFTDFILKIIPSSPGIKFSNALNNAFGYLLPNDAQEVTFLDSKGYILNTVCRLIS